MDGDAAREAGLIKQPARLLGLLRIQLDADYLELSCVRRANS